MTLYYRGETHKLATGQYIASIRYHHRIIAEIAESEEAAESNAALEMEDEDKENGTVNWNNGTTTEFVHLGLFGYGAITH